MGFLDNTGVSRLWEHVSALVNTRVPTTRTINGKTLSGNVTLTAADVGATDIKVNNNLATTTKAYLLGTSTTPAATAQAVESVADTGVYLTTNAGELHVEALEATKVASASGSTLEITSSSTLYFNSGSSSSTIFKQSGTERMRINASGEVEIKSVLRPTSAGGSYTCGTTSYPWNSIYGYNLIAYHGGQRYADMKMNTEGTTSTVGIGRVTLGNNVAKGTAGNACGQILWYGEGTNYITLRMDTLSGNRSLYLRDHGADAYFVAAPSTAAIGSESQPVYVDNKGMIKACTSIAAESAGKDGAGNVIADTYLKISGGTVTGEVNSSATVNLSSAAFRNIKAVDSSVEIIAGTTAIPTGEIWVRYK